jgi:3-methyl-2-oxobutanoate hydroxymethyltransferase
MTSVRSAVNGGVEGAPQSNSAPTDGAVPVSRPVTLRTITRWAKGGVKFPCLTCYDATTARWLQQAGIPVLLAGDSAGEVILGYPTTIHVPLDFLVTITAAVKRGAPNCLVMADMPFMSYQVDDAEAMRNAARFMTEGMADCVKLEVDRSFAPLVEKMTRAGIPVVAHIGFRPQTTKLRGGSSIAGKTASDAAHVVADAVALEAAGATMLLLEASPEEVAAKVVEKTSIPLIGCGAGQACHGQIVVLQDILGLSPRQPAFAPPLCALGDQLIAAAGRWAEMVRTSALGRHPYVMDPGEAERFGP